MEENRFRQIKPIEKPGSQQDNTLEKVYIYFVLPGLLWTNSLSCLSVDTFVINLLCHCC